MKIKLLLALTALLAPILHAEPFKLQATWKLGGEGGWDYLTVDSAAHVLYIARADRIMLVDTTSGKLITEIKGLQRAHGVALAPDGKLGYATDGGAGTVLVFDRATHQVTATVAAGKNPDGILFEPTQHRVFAFNGSSKDATVIDATSNKVLATIPLPGKPEFPVADGAGNVFVNIEDTNQIVRLDATSLKATATWSIAPAKSPSGLAIDIQHHRLFAVCDDSKMAVVDSQTGKLVATPTIGEGPDAAAFDPTHNLIFSSNGESATITILQPDLSLLQTLPTKAGARTMALDSATGTIYTVTADYGPKPAASPTNPRRRAPMLPDSFVVLVYSRN